MTQATFLSPYQTSGQLLALAASGDRGPSAGDLSPWILWDPWEPDGPALSENDTRQLKDWLARAPCPILSPAPCRVGQPSASTALQKLADVLVNDDQELSLICDNILRHPISATVLVQTLRSTQKLAVNPAGQKADPTLALCQESMAYSLLQSGPEFSRWLASYTPNASRSGTQDSGPAVLLERTSEEPETLHLQLNRPSRQNAMSVEMRDALIEALELALADPEISRIELSAKGAHFSTGGDLEEFGQFSDPANSHIVRGVTLPGALLARISERVHVQVHGACVGSGIEFPAFAGRITAHPDSWFQLPELRLGLIPGAGGCVSVLRRIGRQRTAWMVLTGNRIDANTALDWGLVDSLGK